jgi:hypothetical protein
MRLSVGTGKVVSAAVVASVLLLPALQAKKQYAEMTINILFINPGFLGCKIDIISSITNLCLQINLRSPPFPSLSQKVIHILYSTFLARRLLYYNRFLQPNIYYGLHKFQERPYLSPIAVFFGLNW